ncbi:hypothetical protein PAPHI01_1257 [Pancytospora philotis]|nr:hypothetical protein PAPHI01_1257 [Pancytospora philotis]
MQERCKNICTRAIVALKDGPLHRTIQDFIVSSSEILGASCGVSELPDGSAWPGRAQDGARAPTCNQLVNQFYDYVCQKHRIPCECGMLIVERMLTLNAFDRLRQAENTHNTLVNNKIFLYKWIRSEHLEIPFAVPSAVVAAFSKIKSHALPSGKIEAYILAVQELQRSAGKAAGHDQLFSALIYALLKTQIADLEMHFLCMLKYRRRYGGPCAEMCRHGFDINVRCDCLCRSDWKDEDVYYLVMGMAALDFIAKLEFYSLKIGVAEFNLEISARIEKIQLSGQDEQPKIK